MLKKIAINGFRGLHGLSMEDFRRVNVLVGPNGGGKTSVLEALCLAAQPFAPRLVDAINRWRDMPPLSSQTWHTLLTIFSQMDWHRNVSFEMETGEGTASVTISALPGRGGAREPELVQGTTTTTDPGSLSAGFEESVRGLKSVYRPSSGEEVEAVLELVATGYQESVTTKARQPPRGPVPGSFFIHARRATSLGETAAALTELYAKNAEGSFVGALRKVEPRVRRLVPGVRGKQPTVLADLGYATLVPIHVLGDGFCRVSLIATGIVSGQRGKLLLVDEIDSGLHRSVMSGLWGSLLELSHEYGIQVFCSTHNEEMLQETLPAFAGERDALHVYRISRDCDGAVSTQMYDYTMLEDAHAMGMDVR